MDATTPRRRVCSSDRDAMGGDGGTIPGRADLIRARGGASGRDEKPAADDESRLAVWTRCAVSQERLRAGEPAVLDAGGALYGKEALIERHLLAERRLPHLSHIRGLADVMECRLTAAPEGSRAAFSCPLARLEGNGRHAFVAVRPCGCVLSERAWKEVPSEACPVCAAATDAARPVVPLFPPRDVARRLVAEAEARRPLKKDKKKKKKKKKDKGTQSKAGKEEEEPPQPKRERDTTYDSLFVRDNDAAKRPKFL